MTKTFKIIGGVILFLIVSIILMFLSTTQVLILLGIGLVIAFTVSGIQIFLDRKNLAKLDEIDLKDTDNEKPTQG